MAYAGARFTNSILQALSGESDVVECCFVASDSTEARYFSNPILLGGSATLSMAYAGTRFVNSILQALDGEEGIIECAYVRTDSAEAKYFSTPLLLGKEGMSRNLGLGKLIDYEVNLIKAAMPELIKNIEKGEEFVANNPPAK